MKISYNWLKQYIDFDVDAEKLSEILTDCGLEVEGLESFTSVKGGLDGVVIGKVLTKEKHPNADKLSLTTVDIGKDEALKIVCGAPNVDAGQTVVVAPVNTTLYSGDDELKIKKSKIRGEVSEGMICAEDELGLGTSHDGILVIKDEVEIGTAASEYFKIEKDWIFEIGLTPNRADATSHIGVARDLVAALKIHFPENDYKLKIPSTEDFKVDNTNRNIDVIIEDTIACPRYTGLTISGITVKESPKWLKTKLKSLGLKPINNIVDATNFVLFEFGQPLHAFDTDYIKGDKVIVKKMPKDTMFITLDEVERKLTGNDLMICNEDDGMCIAGVFGGIKSGVTENTKSIFIESAYFDTVHVRKTSKHHMLQTDASFRFERGTDPNITVKAIKRAAFLIKEIAGGSISSEIIDVYPEKIENWDIDVTYHNINRLIGKEIGPETVKSILRNLDIEIINENEEGLKLSIPTFKVDVKREVDIIEEILRIYGYNRYKDDEKLRSNLTYRSKPDFERLKNKISNFLSDNSYNETIRNSLTKEDYYSESQLFTPANNVKILNALSKDLSILRQTLLFGGLETIIHNNNRKVFDLKFYEFGNTYKFNHEEKSEDVLKRYTERNHLAIFTSGRKNSESWNTNDENADFFEIKNTVHNIFKKCGLDIRSLETNPINNEQFDYAIEYSYKNKQIAAIGKVNNYLCKKFEIKQDVFYADIHWEELISHISDNSIIYEEVPKFPEVRRDLALLITKTTEFKELEKIAWETERKLLKKIMLFDVYEGEKLEEGKKSYALSFIIQDKEKTLNDKTINKIMQKLQRAFEEKLDAKIR